MEIEVGDYIRTRKGNIGKVLDITDGHKRKKYLIKWDTTDIYYITDIMIKKHHKDIINLVEEKDYVNGKLVYSIGTNIGNIPIVNHTDGTFTPNISIESIVTHEQFERIKYKVKE